MNWNFLQEAKPVIIIGMHRSGTSLLSSLLNSSGIYMGARLSTNDESIFFQNMNRQLIKKYQGRWDSVGSPLESFRNETILQKESESLRNELFRKNKFINYFGYGNYIQSRLRLGKIIWGWKDPRNTITLPVWLSVFPNARVIHIIRNGIDVAISLLRRELCDNKVQIKNRDEAGQGYNFSQFLDLWKEYVHAGIGYSESLNDEQYLQIKYEDLLAIHKSVRQVLLFTGLPNIPGDLIKDIASRINPARLDNSHFRDLLSDLIEHVEKPSILNLLGYS